MSSLPFLMLVVVTTLTWLSRCAGSATTTTRPPKATPSVGVGNNGDPLLDLWLNYQPAPDATRRALAGVIRSIGCRNASGDVETSPVAVACAVLSEGLQPLLGMPVPVVWLAPTAPTPDACLVVEVAALGSGDDRTARGNSDSLASSVRSGSLPSSSSSSSAPFEAASAGFGVTQVEEPMGRSHARVDDVGVLNSRHPQALVQDLSLIHI